MTIWEINKSFIINSAPNYLVCLTVDVNLVGTNIGDNLRPLTDHKGSPTDNESLLKSFKIKGKQFI